MYGENTEMHRGILEKILSATQKNFKKISVNLCVKSL
jgi:hypothetical protein